MLIYKLQHVSEMKVELELAPSTMVVIVDCCRLAYFEKFIIERRNSHL